MATDRRTLTQTHTETSRAIGNDPPLYAHMPPGRRLRTPVETGARVRRFRGCNYPREVHDAISILSIILSYLYAGAAPPASSPDTCAPFVPTWQYYNSCALSLPFCPALCSCPVLPLPHTSASARNPPRYPCHRTCTEGSRHDALKPQCARIVPSRISFAGRNRDRVRRTTLPRPVDQGGSGSSGSSGSSRRRANGQRKRGGGDDGGGRSG